MRHLAPLLVACAAALGIACGAQAQSVVLSGMLGSKALLVVNGGAPKSVAVGQSHQGVKVVSTRANQADVEIGGVRFTLRMGEAPASAGPASDAQENGRIVLHAGGNGHFRAPGQINGRAVSFLVDTGASVVAMSVADADAAGLAYRTGQQVMVNTANGQSVGWRTRLASVRLGSVDVYDVEAVVTPASMPYVLLGNSFLTRFQMTRTNDQLVLERRY